MFPVSTLRSDNSVHVVVVRGLKNAIAFTLVFNMVTMCPWPTLNRSQSLNYFPKHVNSLISPSITYITKFKCFACPLFPIFWSIFHSWPEQADKIALAQERHHLRKLLAGGKCLSSEQLNHSAEEQCVLKPNSPLRFVPEWQVVRGRVKMWLHLTGSHHNTVMLQS